MPINRLTAKSITPTFVTDRLGFTPRSETDVENQISALVDSAPQALNTLNELAAALGDDPNFATTITNSLAGKQATLVSGTNIKTINGESVLGSGDLEIAGGSGAASTVTTTTSFANSNFKVPFINTTDNNSGDYSYLHDNTSNFTYNPSTNTLANVNLAWGVGLPGAEPTTYGGVKGYVRSTTYNSNSGGYEVFVLGENSAIGQYPQRIMGVGHSINISNYVNNSVAIGNRVELGASSSTIVGHYSRSATSSTGTTIVGSESVANSGSIYGTLVGWFSQVSNEGSVALGYNTQASGNYSIALGSLARTGGYNNTTVIHNGNSTFTPSSAGFYATAITSGSSSNVLYYDSNTKKITYGAPAGGNLALGDLTNVNISNPTSGQVLKYNGTAWVNGTDETGGGGTEEPVAPDVFRSTKIVPVNVFRNGSYTTIITFSSAAEANYVRNFLIKISTTFTNQGGSKFVRFAQSSGYGNQIDIDSNFQGWSNVSGSTLSINNYYVNEPSYPGGGVRVGYYYPDQTTITPDNKLVIGTGNIDSLVTLDPAWSPHGIEVYNPNVSGMATRIIPASSPSLTPAIREYTSPTTSIIEFTLDLNNNPPLEVNPFNGIGYVAFILGKYELVDPNAPEPWYTVQDGTTNQLNGQISVPSGFNAQTFGQYDKLVLIGNAPYNSSQYFYPFNSFNNGPSIGSSSQNNQTRTFFTRNPSTDPFIGYGYFSQNRGLVAAFAQPLPSSTSTVTGMVQGDDSYSNFDGRGFFRSHSAAYLTNSMSVGAPPPGGTVKFKAVMVFTQPVEVAIFSGYTSATGTLLETFTYQDYDWGTITRFVFFTCTNDTIARQMCTDQQPILQFSQSPGGPPFSVEHLAWAWWERTQ